MVLEDNIGQRAAGIHFAEGPHALFVCGHATASARGLAFSLGGLLILILIAVAVTVVLVDTPLAAVASNQTEALGLDLVMIEAVLFFGVAGRFGGFGCHFGEMGLGGIVVVSFAVGQSG